VRVGRQPGVVLPGTGVISGGQVVSRPGTGVTATGRTGTAGRAATRTGTVAAPVGANNLRLSANELQALARRCPGILAEPASFDADLVELCRLSQRSAQR
jgi:hypothetical protein